MCFDQLSIWWRVASWLVAAVGPLAEDRVEAGFCGSSRSFGRGPCGGSVGAVGSSEESQEAAQLQQSTLWQRVVWRLIVAVGPTAEDRLAAGLGVVYSSVEIQTVAPLNKSDLVYK